MTSSIPQTKKCIICGGEFKARNSRHLTCSPECSRERAREWQQEYNRERYSNPKFLEQSRKRYVNDREYRERHSEYMRKWYQKRCTNDPTYRERLRERNQKRQTTPKHQEYMRLYEMNRRARKRELPATLTDEQWQYALDYFHGCCAVCGRQLNDLFGHYKVHQDHWLPLTYEGNDNPGTVVHNIVPLCKPCNLSKKNTQPADWLIQRFSKRKAHQILARIEEYFRNLP